MRTLPLSLSLTACAVAVALLCAESSAHAQTPPAAPNAAAASASAPVRLDPVVVTGSRVAKRAFDAPLSISVVDADTLRSAGPQINVSEALSRVPGLAVSNRNNYAQDLQISSRGFGARASFGVRGLRLYADGIPATMPDGSGQVSHFDLASAERIEVLRGPFSALYGNSSGGVIALFTPPAKVRQATAEVQAGSQGSRVLRGSVAAPLGDGWDLQANWTGFQTDGYRPHSEAQRHSLNARLGWRDAHNTVTALASHMTQPAHDALGLTRAQFNANPYQTAPQATAYNTRKDLSQTQLGASWQHRFADSALRDSTLAVYDGNRSATQWQSIAAPPVSTAQNSATHPGGVIDFDRHYRGLDARLHWQWPSAQLVAGINLENQTDNRQGYQNFIGTQLGVTGALKRDERNTARSRDLYAQGDWQLSPAVNASAGLRSGRIRYATQDHYLSNGDDSDTLGFSYTNPVLGLAWKPHKDWNLYASAGRGFEAPTLTELAYRADGSSGFNTALAAQTSQQFEVGSKWRDVEAAVGLDVALFRATTHNEIGVASNSGGRASYRNVGRTQRHGLELAGRWEPSEQWRARVALTWLSARYADDALQAAGQRIAGTAPRSVFAELAWHNAERGGSEVGIELRGQGPTPANDSNADIAAGYTLLALRATHTLDIDERTSLQFFGRIDNLTDKVHIGSVIVNDAQSRFFEPGTPRALMLGAKLVARW